MCRLQKTVLRIQPQKVVGVFVVHINLYCKSLVNTSFNEINLMFNSQVLGSNGNYCLLKIQYHPHPPPRLALRQGCALLGAFRIHAPALASEEGSCFHPKMVRFKWFNGLTIQNGGWTSQKCWLNPSKMVVPSWKKWWVSSSMWFKHPGMEIFA